MFIEDLHVHTTFSFDATATMEEQILEAIDKKVNVICFTDHIDIDDLSNSFAKFDFVGRKLEYNRLLNIYGDKIKMLIGLEFGEPNLFPQKKAQILADYPYDMIIGSVHAPTEQIFVGTYDPRKISQEHYEHTLEMVTVGGFDVLGHLDFPKKFMNGFVQNDNISKEILRTCVRNDIVIEINTSTLRKGFADPCPPMNLVQYYRDIGGKYVVITTDSHDNGTIASNYERIYKALPIGLKVCYFEKRKLIEAD